jgi:hypothetical protein
MTAEEDRWEIWAPPEPRMLVFPGQAAATAAAMRWVAVALAIVVLAIVVALCA